MLHGPIWVLGAAYHTPHLAVPLLPTALATLFVLSGAWNRRWFFSRPRLLCTVLYHLDYMIQQIFLKYLKYQWQIGDVVGSLCQEYVCHE